MAAISQIKPIIVPVGCMSNQIRILSGNSKGPGDRQAIEDSSQAIVVNTNARRWRRPTFYNVKADTAVNKVSPDRRAAIGAVNSHTIKVVNSSKSLGYDREVLTP